MTEVEGPHAGPRRRHHPATGADPMGDVIRVACEGAGCPPARSWGGYGICAMCGRLVLLAAPSALVSTHKRDDVMAMLTRGDFGTKAGPC